MRVFCRVKPLGTNTGSFINEKGEKEQIAALSMFDQELISFPQLAAEAKGKKVTHQSLELSMPRTGNPIVYNFDHVFLPDCSQNEVFEEIKPFVQTAMDGENTCIFAYG